MDRPYSVHLKFHDKRLEKHLDDRFGKDRRKRKGVSNYIEYLALMGLDRLERREAGFDLHYLGKSDLPSIDLYHIFKIDGQDVDVALHKLITPHQLYNIDLSRKRLNVAAMKKAYVECIRDLDNAGYNWRDYMGPS